MNTGGTSIPTVSPHPTLPPSGGQSACAVGISRAKRYRRRKPPHTVSIHALVLYRACGAGQDRVIGSTIGHGGLR